MEQVDFDVIRQRIFYVYRRAKGELSRIEKKSIETPSEELKMRAAEARGVLVGIQKALSCVEVRANDHEFPQFEEEARA
jgi:hypothetical protein